MAEEFSPSETVENSKGFSCLNYQNENKIKKNSINDGNN